MTDSSAEWKALREEDLSNTERDRRAILAMAGEFRASSISGGGSLW